MVRTTNRRKFLQGISATSAVSAIGLTGCTDVIPSDDPFVIGVSGIMSGPFGVIGEYTLRGVEMGIAAVEEEGGIGGQEIELHSYDAADASVGVREARELVEVQDIDAMIMGQSSAVSLGVQEYIASVGDVICTEGGGLSPTQEYWEESGCQESFFRLESNLLARNNALAQRMAEVTPDDYTDLAGIIPNYTYGHQTWDAFSGFFDEHRFGVEHVQHLTPDFGKGDYTDEINALLNADPDILYTSLWAGDIIAFISQAQEFGLFDQIEYFCQGGILFDIMPQLDEQLPEMWAVPYWFFTQPNTAQNMEFVELYDEMFDDGVTVDAPGSDWDGLTVPIFGTVEYGHTAVRALRDAVDRGGGADFDSMVTGLEGLDIETVRGPGHVRASDHEFIEPLDIGHTGDVDYWQFRGYDEFERYPGEDMEPDPVITCD